VILIVEDSKIINKALTKKLQSLGYEVESVFTFKEAKEKLQQKKYDLIVLDLHLPDGEGRDLIESVHSLTDTKIVVMTTSTDEELREELFELGIIDYIIKDKNLYFSIQEVADVIENFNKRKTYRLLVIDDSKFITKQLEKMLQPRKYEVDVAFKGKDGIELIKSNDYDLVILDMQLPDIHGLEVLNYIRSSKDYSHIPVIVLTGSATPELVRKILKSGANDLLKKPFIIEEFILKIDLWIDYFNKERELEKKNKELEYVNKYLQDLVALEIQRNREQEKMMMLQSRQAQMGEMIAMIAHQWKQPLNSINMAMHIIKLEAKKLNNEKIISLVEKIEKQVKHLAETIEEFRNFFKPQKKRVKTNLKEIVLKALSLIEDSLKDKNIKVIKEFKNIRDCSVYENEMVQVVLNILKNAEDALVERGVKNPEIHILVDGKMLIIEDNAGGIANDIKNKIFEPYFSTKDKNGTGIGLYMSKIIVEEHCNGKLLVENGTKGARFIIKI